MAEQVTTGGVKTFSYVKGYESKLDEGRKKDIKEAYGRYYERKENEEKRKKTYWVVVLVVILILIILGVLVLR